MNKEKIEIRGNLNQIRKEYYYIYIYHLLLQFDDYYIKYSFFYQNVL